MSVAVRWYSLELPPTARIRKLRVYAGTPVFRDCSGQAAPDSPCQRSLMVEADFHWSQLDGQHVSVAADDMIQTMVLPAGFLVASFKDGGELAFISCSFHSHQLVQRCIKGTSSSVYTPEVHKPLKDDIDSRYGLHSYSCTVELRNNRNTYWSQQFLNLHSRQEDIGSGYLHLNLVSPDNRSQHSTFLKELNLPWKTDVFKGILKNICILDVTVLDDRNKPMWCASSAVQVQPKVGAAVTYDYEGESSRIGYLDSTGKIDIEIVWDPDTTQFFVTSAVLHLSLEAINSWFGTCY